MKLLGAKCATRFKRGETCEGQNEIRRKNNKKLGLRLNYFPLFVYLLIFCFNLIFFVFNNQ